MTTVGAVVVHHRRYPEVLETISHVIAGGVTAGAVVVVDNSECASASEALRASLPPGVSLVCVRNRGYGQAANEGARRLGVGVDHVIVATHETVPHPGAIRMLSDALLSDPQLAAVGPTLVTRSNGVLTCWSQGGRLTRIMNRPLHIGHEVPFEASDSVRCIHREWLDGAFAMYRGDALRRFRFREDFFLYFEETELHRRLVKAGFGIGWIPAAVVEQSSNGVSPYYLGRNMQKFQDAHGGAVARRLAVPWEIYRRGIRRLVRGGPRHELRDIVRGWREAKMK